MREWKAGERKEESSQGKKKTKYNAVPTVHENVVKYLEDMLFYMIKIPGSVPHTALNASITILLQT